MCSAVVEKWCVKKNGKQSSKSFFVVFVLVLVLSYACNGGSSTFFFYPSERMSCKWKRLSAALWGLVEYEKAVALRMCRNESIRAHEYTFEGCEHTTVHETKRNVENEVQPGLKGPFTRNAFSQTWDGGQWNGKKAKVLNLSTTSATYMSQTHVYI